MKPGEEAAIVVEAHRMPDVKNAVTVLPLWLANGMVVTKAGQVPPDKYEVTITVTADKTRSRAFART